MSLHSQRSADDYLPALINSIGSSLLKQGDRLTIYEIGRQIPINLTKSLVFEVRLGEKLQHTDFSICIQRSEANLLEQFLKQQTIRTSWATATVNAIDRFSSLWSNPESVWHQKIHVIWFEFDAGETSHPTLAPGFFFGLKSVPDFSIDTEANLNNINSLLEPLIGDNSSSYQGTLRTCIASLPVGAHIFQIGLFFNRPNFPLRLCITRIDPGQIVPYLQSIGYCGDLSQIEKDVEEIAPLCKIDLAIDIYDRVGEKIGLECHQMKGSPFELVEKDAQFFDYLVKKQWCTPQKQIEMKAFFGFSAFPELRDDSTANVWGAKRDIMHCKLVYHSGAAIEAKGYLLAEVDRFSSLEVVKNNLLYKALDMKNPGTFANQAEKSV